MVAHARQGSGRRRLLAGPHQMHQPGTGPPRGRVEAGLVGFRAGFAVAGEGCIDQPLVERRQIVIGDAEATPHRRRVVGDEYIRIGDQPPQYSPARRRAQIEREAFLVAAVEHKTGVAREPGPDRRRGAPAIGVARARRLDLDHRGAEIRHHRRGRRPRDKARAVDHLQPVEDTLTHSSHQAKCRPVAHDTSGRPAGEMRADHENRAIGKTGQHSLTGLPRLGRIAVRRRRPFRAGDLARVVHEIAGDQRLLALRDDPSIVFQPTWSTWRWVQTTVPIVSGG